MSTSTNANDATVKGRGALIGLAALFFVPLLGAFWLYYAGGWRPAGSTNHGELISPARPLAAIDLRDMDGAVASPELFKGKWTLVHVNDGACDETCRKTLWTIRQTRLLLAEDIDRVQRAFVVTGNCCDRGFLTTEHPGLLTVSPSGPAAAEWLAQFPQQPGTPYVYIVDPLGNLMMRFDARENPKGLLSDLEKLLKLSHIG